MLKFNLQGVGNRLKMVKNKREMKSPRRNRSLTKSRPATRSRPNSQTIGANIRVIVRVRPPNDREINDNRKTVVKVVNDSMLVFDPKEDDEPFFYHGVQQRGRDLLKRANKNLQFQFDRVFGFDNNNEDIFKDSTQSLIKTLMDGYNCSVFVYGATGAGKTYTMLGNTNNPGITFLTMAELFQRKEELSVERDFKIDITYLEVYNETVKDLLRTGPALQVREDGKYGVVVTGLQVHRIESSEELFHLLEQGNRNRTQHPTDANAESSRSHAVFQVYLQMNIRATGEVRIAKLSMIDLAGSERGAATGCNGARFTEGANINKSLLALGNCINSLADGQRHVPYRDSKLTRLLKDSLGGNCQTVMIANVSPSPISYEDTYNTLKYATRAKKIKSNMKKNVINCETNITYYIKLVEELTLETERLKMQLASKTCTCKTEEENNKELRTQLKSLYGNKIKVEQDLEKLKSSKELLTLRKQFKEEADARLSGLCADNSQKEEGHRRLGNALEKLQFKDDNVQDEMVSMQEEVNNIDIQLQEFLMSNPQLKEYAMEESLQLENIKNKIKAEHLQKERDLLKGELRIRDQLLGRMSEVLQPCFLQLKGHGHATQDLSHSYQEMLRLLQGCKSVAFKDISKDIDVGPSSSRNVNVLEDENRASKRKLPEETNSVLDSTFSRSPAKPPVRAINVCAEQLMAKVYKPPPAKRVAKVNSASQSTSKENRPPFRTGLQVKDSNIQRKPLRTDKSPHRMKLLSGQLSRPATSVQRSRMT